MQIIIFIFSLQVGNRGCQVLNEKSFFVLLKYSLVSLIGRVHPSLAMKTLKITESQLAEMLENHKGLAIVGIDALTDARARKTGNPFEKVEKLSRFVGFVGMDYSRAVNRELESQGRETSFEAKPLQWGEWMKDKDGKISRKIITHKGKLYFATTSNRKIRLKKKVKVQFYADGLPVDKETIAAFLPAKRVSERQSDAGLEDGSVQVERRTFAFSSAKRIRFNGKNYSIIPG